MINLVPNFPLKPHDLFPPLPRRQGPRPPACAQDGTSSLLCTCTTSGLSTGVNAASPVSIPWAACTARSRVDRTIGCQCTSSFAHIPVPVHAVSTYLPTLRPGHAHVSSHFCNATTGPGWLFKLGAARYLLLQAKVTTRLRGRCRTPTPSTVPSLRGLE